jgi:hypothetical protein
MNSLEDQLNTRYNLAIQSHSERDFYMRVYDYMNFIFSDPNLKRIWDESEKEYDKSHTHIVSNFHGIIDVKNGMANAYKLESFNLYSVGLPLWGKIYLPIHEYEKSKKSIDEENLLAIILVHGADAALKMGQWAKSEFRRYNEWYDGKRNFYESALQNFHSYFLRELSNTKSEKKPGVDSNKEKQTILSFNSTTGDFSFFKIVGNLSPGSREFKVFQALYEASENQLTYLELIKTYVPHVEKESKALKDDLYIIIKNIKNDFQILPKRKAGLPDIFKNIKNYGYRLDLSHSRIKPD